MHDGGAAEAERAQNGGAAVAGQACYSRAILFGRATKAVMEMKVKKGEALSMYLRLGNIK